MCGLRKQLATLVALTAAISMFAGCGTASAESMNSDKNGNGEHVSPIVTESDSEEIKDDGVQESENEQPVATEDVPVAETPETAIETPEKVKEAEPSEAKEYNLYVGWTYIEGVTGIYDPMMGDMEICISDGSSHVDASDYHMEEIAGGEYAYYYKVNGEDVPVYTMFLHMDEDTSGHYEVKILRDDLRYDIAWMSGPENYYTDCHAEIESDGALVEESSYEDHKVRGATGIWYYGICSIKNGELYDYEYLQ